MLDRIFQRSRRSIGRVLRFCRNLGKEEVLVIGDSHAAVFHQYSTSGKPYWFNVVSVGGATISGLENPNSVTQARPIFEKALALSQSKTCIVIVGEVDAGFVIWYRAAKHRANVEEILEQTVERYGDFLSEIAATHRTICISAPLPTILDDQNWGEVANKRREVTATQKERTQLTLELNRRMEAFCESNKIAYINLDEESLGPDSLVKGALCSRNDADHHYDSETYLKVLAPKLSAVLVLYYKGKHVTSMNPLATVKRIVRKHAVRTGEVSGRKFRYPLVPGLGVRRMDAHEQWMIDILTGLRGHIDGVFVDVGANTGQTMVKALSVLDTPYVGFEPNSACVCYLNMLVRENELENCTIIPAAVGGEVGVAKLAFFSHRSTDATATLRPELRGRAPESYLHIVIVDLIDTLQKLGVEQVGMMKVDVEGGELEVLQSADPGIREWHPIILIEVLAVGNEERAKRLETMNELVGGWNYRFLRIDKKGDGALASLKVVEQVRVEDNQKACDYLLVPADRVEGIANLHGK